MLYFMLYIVHKYIYISNIMYYRVYGITKISSNCINILYNLENIHVLNIIYIHILYYQYFIINS